ncbi:MAG TPA: penicillin-binding protein 2, partial [Candidatus Angelobacter sp.]|nr:penicillin-binding protein 2 [Candidatus Angelobacter sp.]
EQQYNDILMGKDGSRLVQVDSKGREVGQAEGGRLSQEPAVVGKPLKLTIDLDLQIAAEEALEGKNGALVALDPRTGEVLAMVSRPIFDPNDFAVRIKREEWKRLVTDEAHPLLNKAIQAQLAPGSVFKIIMSVAGMQEGIAQNLHVNCGGGGVFYGRFFKCWVTAEHRVHGGVDISKGIYQSCDTFFYTLAERLGIEKISKWAMAFGLGQKTGIDLPNEASGVMPSEEWKIKNFRQKWYAGETISVGIGQGAVATTPIQLARAIGGIAMGGVLYRPHVVAPDQLPEGMRTPVKTVRLPIDPQNWTIITDAMAGVVNPIGTAPSAHLQGIDFAGKTGSAQVISNTLRKSKAGAGSGFKDNGWFVGVAPRRNPEVVVAVLLEQGEHGYLAARIASQIIKAYVEKQRRIRNNPMLFSDKVNPDSVPMAALWNRPDADNADSTDGAKNGENQTADEFPGHLQGGTLLVKTGKPARKNGSAAALAAVLPAAEVSQPVSGERP